MSQSGQSALQEGIVHPARGATRSLAGTLRTLQDLATAAAASDFAAFFITAARERGRLTPALDSEYPGVSVPSRILSSSFGNEIVKRAVSSTMPSWWSGEREIASTRAFEMLRGARQTALGLPDMPGIALPVYTDNGAAGLIAFFGTEITITDQSMSVLHARCFSLFADLVRLQPGQAGGLPAVTQRELDCLKLTASGHTSEEIALVIGLSVHTTNQYLTKVTFKLDAVNRIHAVAKALRLGLIE